MANVHLTRNLGTLDARILDVEPSEAREGRSIDVEGDVRDELVLAGLAHEGEDLGTGGLDLNDPEIKKKLEEKEVEQALAAGLLQLQQERNREYFERTSEAEGELLAERDRLRDQKRRQGEQLMEERRNEPPRGPEEQPREFHGGVYHPEGGDGGKGNKPRSRTMGRESTDVETEEEREQEEKRRREQARPGQPGQPQPAPSQPRPGQPAQPGQPTGPIPSGPGRTGGGSSGRK